ncbi:MAG: hypothetical protein KC609_20990, partial [Myxococcales bacterium]|nr:hypothetical protein [Myxococcales bacterium]
TANATNVTMSGGWQKAFVVNSDGMLNIVSSQLVAAFAECFACKLVLGTSTFSGRLDVSGTTAEVSIDSTRFSGSATLLQQTPADSGFLEIVNSTFFEGKVILWGNATLRFNTVHGMTTGGIAFNSDYGPTTTPVELVGNLVVAPKTGIRYRSHWKLTANNVDAIEKGAEYLSQSGETTVPSGNTTLHAVLRYSASDPYPRLQPGSDPALFDALDPSQVPEISVDYWGRSRVDKLDIGAIEAPTILSVTPNAGRRGDSLTLALNGVNLVGPISVALLSVEPQSCNTCVVSSACREGFLNDFCWSCLLDSCGVPGIVLDGQALTPESTTSLRSSLALGLSDSVALGTYHLLLGEPDVEDGITVIPSFFTVHDKLAATTIEPTTGAQGTKLTLTVTGTGLDLGTPSVSFGDPKLAVSNVQVAPGGTSLTFDLDVDPAAALGGYTLTVTGGDGKTTTLPSALTVTPVVVEPDTVEPDSGSDPDLAVAPDADPDLAVAPDADPDLAVAPDADPDLAVAPDADPDLAVAPDADPDVSVAPDTTATPDVARSDISSDIPDGASANGDVVGELDANPGSSDTADATPTPDLSTGGNTSSKSSSGGCTALDATPSSQPLVLLLIFVIGSLLLRRVARRVMAQ